MRSQTANAMDDDRHIPNWLLWILARPLLAIGVMTAVVVGIPAAVIVYFDYRIERLAEEGADERSPNEPSGAVPGIYPQHVVRGQTVYVPLYSHVYQGGGERLQLAGTLSIRNTDAEHDLTITAVRYYDTEGTPIRNFLKTPLTVKPMGSTDFFIKESDTSGGSGANFVVEWVSDKPVHEPVIEAVMVGRKGGSVTAFVRPGVVTKQIRRKAPANGP